MKFKFLDKTLFFPQHGILAVGDLHLGYDYMIQQSGVLIPERQVEEIIIELKNIFNKMKSKKQKLRKIVFIGDLKHSFAYEWKEKNYFNKVLNFLKENLKEKDIIFIKGNHDTIDYTFDKKLKDYYIEKDIAFLHGDKFFSEVFDSRIKTIVIGHIHPSIILSDKQGIKEEIFKCFLVGKFKGKEIIILPSFLSTIEGSPINNYSEEYEDCFSIMQKKDLMNFTVHTIGDNKIYKFEKIKKLIKNKII
ncbi:MAG: metallophosphoesterase [Candidatus Pacearchaeota archaeon]